MAQIPTAMNGKYLLQGLLWVPRASALCISVVYKNAEIDMPYIFGQVAKEVLLLLIEVCMFSVSMQ